MTRHSFNAEMDFDTSPKESTATYTTLLALAGIGIDEVLSAWCVSMAESTAITVEARAY
jgi:hypothetical protein